MQPHLRTAHDDVV